MMFGRCACFLSHSLPTPLCTSFAFTLELSLFASFLRALCRLSRSHCLSRFANLVWPPVRLPARSLPLHLAATRGAC
uniref:Putative secreted protein n=1 Tax=Anopheles triannulatus TaxID=58253 RepID=A0A2M4B3W0_9DIPT